MYTNTHSLTLSLSVSLSLRTSRRTSSCWLITWCTQHHNRAATIIIARCYPTDAHARGHTHTEKEESSRRLKAGQKTARAGSRDEGIHLPEEARPWNPLGEDILRVDLSGDVLHHHAGQRGVQPHALADGRRSENAIGEKGARQEFQGIVD